MGMQFLNRFFHKTTKNAHYQIENGRIAFAKMLNVL